MSDIYQIKFHSRGGQGAKTAAQILAEAAIDEGKFAQAFSEYGPERSGAPMKCFLRISGEPIRIHSEIQNPDLVVIIDPTLMELAIKENEKTVKRSNNYNQKMVKLLNGYIVNTSQASEKIKRQLKNICLPTSRKSYSIYTLDATKISLDKLGKNIPNMPMTGAIVGLTNLVSLDSVIKRIRERFEKKLGKELTEKNVEALREGYRKFKIQNSKVKITRPPVFS